MLDSDLIRKYVLQNAIRYKGKANAGNVIGKVFQVSPELKASAKELNQEIQRLVGVVNAMTLEEQEAELKKNAPEMLEVKKHEKREGLKALKNAEKGKVIMRFEPSPSGPMHIGHSYPLMLNYQYCKDYDGKLILRISDTNPANIDPNAYKLLEEDFNWLCSDVKTEVIIQSDRMGIYYKHADQLVKDGHAYVCTCPAEEFRELMKKKEECPCRNKTDHMKRWKAMFDIYKEGEAVLRAKTDVKDKNPAMRDFPLIRISETVHPRTRKKYRVWPLLNFAVPIDDHESGLTHVLRGKDHYDNTQRQLKLFKCFGWDAPEYIHLGRINFEGLRLSTTDTRKDIEEGTYSDWDDIRLPTLKALKRRGYQPGAFLKFAISVGITMVDKTVKAEEFFKTIEFFNKEIIDPISHRYFFIEYPMRAIVKDAPKLNIKLDLHPENRKGGRVFKTANQFFISVSDFIDIKEGEMIRFMDCLNCTKHGEGFNFVDTDYETYKEKGKKIIHWLPGEGELIKTSVLMIDGSIKSGLAESGIRNLRPGSIVQFERFGFVRLDQIGNEFKFWFLHK